MSVAGSTLKRVLRERSGRAQRRAWAPRRHVVIQTREDLDGLVPALARTLGRDLDVMSLNDRLCPVSFDDGSAGVFVLADYCHDDQTLAVLDLLEARGWKLSEPSLFILPPALLLAVDRLRPANPAGGAYRSGSVKVERSALVSAFDEIVQWGLANGASDIHLNASTAQPESRVRFTIAGRYVSPERYRNIPTAAMLDMLSVAWMDVQGGNGAVFDPLVEQQGRLMRRIDGRSILLRWASLATDAGPSVCLRLLVMDHTSLTPDLATLGYLPSQVALFERARLVEGGAIVLAGVVGSGKSTTIATLIRDVPPDRKVITLEDPAEYLIPTALQNTVSRTLDEHDGNAFDAKLKTIKRSAMTDLLIGEIRDLTSGRAFMDLAGCGTNLYTTVHAGSALLICERLTSDFIGVSRDLLATPGILKLLVFQCLLPTVCAHCALSATEMIELPVWRCAAGVSRSPVWRADWLGALERNHALARGTLRFRSPHGCARCGSARDEALSGCAGRTVVAEMIEPGRSPRFLAGVKERDSLGLHAWFGARPRSRLDDPCMDGKTALEAALYKMVTGQIDPRDIESRFGPLGGGQTSGSGQ